MLFLVHQLLLLVSVPVQLFVVLPLLVDVPMLMKTLTVHSFCITLSANCKNWSYLVIASFVFGNSISYSINRLTSAYPVFVLPNTYTNNSQNSFVPIPLSLYSWTQSVLLVSTVQNCLFTWVPANIALMKKLTACNEAIASVGILKACFYALK